LTTFQATVQSIIYFKRNFSVSEYKKRNERDHKKQEITNSQDVLYYSILFPIINGFENKWLWEKYILNNPILFEYTLLENYVQSFESITRENERREQLNQYLRNLSSDTNQMTAQSFGYVQGDSLASDFESLKQQFERYQDLRSQANQVDKNLNDLMQLTLNLTKSFEEVEKLFRLMCFNVFSHNRDDHSKNFSFCICFSKASFNRVFFSIDWDNCSYSSLLIS